jgi:hypothetical protein
VQGGAPVIAFIVDAIPHLCVIGLCCLATSAACRWLWGGE